MPASELSQSLQIFANLLLVIALPIVIAAAFQHLRVMSRQLQERIGEERWQRIDQVVTAAVRFAEQAGVVEGLIGAEKKQMAVDYVQRKLADYGVTGIDVAAIADLVENEVRHQFANPTPPEDTLEARHALINNAIEAAILAAQQGGLTGIIEDVGQQKKEYAIRFAQNYLRELGIEIPEDIVSGLIEAQLLRMIAQQTVLQ